MAYDNQSAPTDSVLVIGANSFAGSWVVDAALNAGYRVIGVNRSAETGAVFLPCLCNALRRNYEFHQLDLNRDWDALASLLSRTRPTFVVDFAGQGMVAQSWDQPEQWYQTNIVAKVKLHDLLRKQASLKHYVRVSTPEVYGSTDQPVDENQPYRPSTPYAVSHAAIDLSLAAFHRQYRFPVTLTRFANFFGPGQQLYRIIPRTILSVLDRGKLQLHGGGHAVRAFIYVTDVASAVLRVLRSGGSGEIYHFSPNTFISIRELVERICKKMEVRFADVVEVTEDRPGKDQAYLMNADKARSQLQWQPRVDLDSGLDATIAWTTQHFAQFKQLDWNYRHQP